MAPPDIRNVLDIVVIGAGMYGIQSSRTYLEIHPDAQLAILEASTSVGGAWSKDRVYEFLRTQDSTTVAEFSDVTLEVPPADVVCGLFPANYMTQYLETYARSHTYAGLTIADRVVFESRVQMVKKADDGLWHVTLADSTVVRAAKVIDCSGITTEPELPNIPHRDTFQGIQMHMRDLSSSGLLRKTECQHVAVLGGAKSGADACYSAAKAGKKVTWIIRQSGNGPCWFSPLHPPPIFKSADEPLLSRFLLTISVSHFAKDTWLTWLLNQTALGRAAIRGLWRFIEGDFRARANYDRPDPKGHNFKSLQPDTPLFWANDSTGVEQREDFFDTIAEHVQVIRQDMARMDTDAVVLTDGRRIVVDTVVYGTGFQQTPGHYDPRTALDLGLPVPLQLGPAASVDHDRWVELEADADKAVLARFPILADPPAFFVKEAKTTPYRLYQSISPIHDTSIVFLGRFSVVNAWRMAEAQSLWAVAALDGHVHAKQDAAAMEQDVAQTVAWARRRYLNKGLLANWFLWDCIAYTDRLLAELGLTSHLGKEGSFSPCRAKSLAGLIDEYKKKYAH